MAKPCYRKMFWKKRKVAKKNYQSFPQNPYNKLFSKKRPALSRFPSAKPKTKRVFTLIFVTTVIGLSIYYIFFSGFFNITTVTINNETLENESLSKEIDQKIRAVIGKNIIFTSTSDLEISTLKAFQDLEEINISKNYPNTIEIEFKEYTMVANLINESSSLKKSYIINSVGYVVKEDYENPILPYIREQTDEPINPKEAAIDKIKLDIILNTIKYFEDKFGMKVKEVVYKPIAREIHLLTERGFYIWLDIQQSTEDQLKKLKKALVKLNIYEDSFAYIDLRISGSNGDKIIYKRK